MGYMGDYDDMDEIRTLHRLIKTHFRSSMFEYIEGVLNLTQKHAHTRQKKTTIIILTQPTLV